MKHGLKVVAVTAMLGSVFTTPIAAHESGMGQGQMPMMGQGQMPMMGQGQMPMMSQGQMPMMRHGAGSGMYAPLRRDLSAEEVEHMIGHRIEWQGNANLTMGPVVEQDADTIVADIVTQDGSLVQRLEVNRHTGMMRAAN